MVEIRCADCTYDLRGQNLRRTTIRCPECGRRTTLLELSAEIVRRRRSAVQLHREIAVVIAVVAVTVGLASAGGLRIDLPAIADHLRWLHSPLGLGAAILTTTVLLVIATIIRPEARIARRIGFAILVALLALAG